MDLLTQHLKKWIYQSIREKLSLKYTIFLTCFNITNSYLFWSECLKALRSIDQKFFFWCGDQEAIRIAATLNCDFNIGTLDESEFACLPEYVNKDNLPNLIHYKGPNRRGLMIVDAYKYIL